MHAWVCMPTHSHATTHTKKRGGRERRGKEHLGGLGRQIMNSRLPWTI